MENNNLAKKNYINNLLNTYFDLFVVVFVVFLLFIAYFLLLKPKVDETISAISENISSHEKLLQAEKNKLTSLQEAVASYQKISEIDLQRVNGILPNDYDKEALYGEIEEFVKQNGFIPTSITLTKEDEKKKTEKDNNSKTPTDKDSSKIGEINISLALSGIDYAGLKNFLGAIESNLRLMDVKSLSLNGSNSATLEITTYYYKP
jgi:Tfp pilus assembly protein PilO